MNVEEAIVISDAESELTFGNGSPIHIESEKDDLLLPKKPRPESFYGDGYEQMLSDDSLPELATMASPDNREESYGEKNRQLLFKLKDSMETHRKSKHRQQLKSSCILKSSWRKFPRRKNEKYRRKHKKFEEIKTKVLFKNTLSDEEMSDGREQESDTESDEIDLINLNISRSRSRKKNRNLMKKAVVCITPLSTSFSCIEKPNNKKKLNDLCILDVKEKDLSEPQYFSKNEVISVSKQLNNEIKERIDSPVSAEKLKIHFETFSWSPKKEPLDDSLPLKLDRHFLDFMKCESDESQNEGHEEREKNVMDFEESPLPKIQLRKKRCIDERGLNLFQRTILNKIDLSKTNLYASSVPLQKIELASSDLYLSDLPLVTLDINTPDQTVTPLPLESQHFPVKNQPLITSFFAPLNHNSHSIFSDQSTDNIVKSSDSLTSVLLKTEKDFIDGKNQPEKEKVLATKVTSNAQESDADSCCDAIYDCKNYGKKYETKKLLLPIRECSVKLKRLSKDLPHKDELLDLEDEIDTFDSKNKVTHRKGGRKRKVNCERLMGKESHISSHITSLISQKTSACSSKLSYDRQLKQLECFMQEARIGCNLESAQVLPVLPQSHVNIIESCLEEGSKNLKHGLDFLRWSNNHYRIQQIIMSEVLRIAFSTEITKEIVFEAYHLLQQVNITYPGQFRVELKTIEKSLEKTELAIFQKHLLFKFLNQVVKRDLYSRKLNEQRELKKSIAYRLLSQDEHSQYPSELVKYLGLLINGSPSENTSKLPSGKYFVDYNMTELIQELLAISVEVSTNCIYLAGQLAEQLKKLYLELSGMGKKLLLNSIKSSLIRYKLTELILESEYNGTSLLTARFPDSVLQIMECFSKAIPMKAVSEGKVWYSSGDCEELAMLIYNMVTSYLQACRSKTNQSLRARVDYYACEDLVTLPTIDELNLLLEYIDDFLDHLLSLNAELTPSTEHYILLLQCLSDLDN